MVAIAPAENEHTAVARILGDLRRRGGLWGADIANIVDVPPPAVSRWSHGNGSPSLHVQTVIANPRYVVERLSDFYTPDETRLWLHASHPLLARERPVDLIHARRTEEIFALVDRMEADGGVPVGDSRRRRGIRALRPLPPVPTCPLSLSRKRMPLPERQLAKIHRTVG